MKAKGSGVGSICFPFLAQLLLVTWDASRPKIKVSWKSLFEVESNK